MQQRRFPVDASCWARGRGLRLDARLDRSVIPPAVGTATALDAGWMYEKSRPLPALGPDGGFLIEVSWSGCASGHRELAPRNEGRIRRTAGGLLSGWTDGTPGHCRPRRPHRRRGGEPLTRLTGLSRYCLIAMRRPLCCVPIAIAPSSPPSQLRRGDGRRDRQRAMPPPAGPRAKKPIKPKAASIALLASRMESATQPAAGPSRQKRVEVRGCAAAIHAVVAQRALMLPCPPEPFRPID
jgi:hypothetical protein